MKKHPPVLSESTGSITLMDVEFILNSHIKSWCPLKNEVEISKRAYISTLNAHIGTGLLLILLLENAADVSTSHAVEMCGLMTDLFRHSRTLCASQRIVLYIFFYSTAEKCPYP